MRYGKGSEGVGLFEPGNNHVESGLNNKANWIRTTVYKEANYGYFDIEKEI